MAADEGREYARNQPEKRALYDALVARDGELCAWCGANPPLTIDHRVPGDGDGLENLQLLCGPCNSSKGNSTEDKSVRWQSGLFQHGFTMVPNTVLLDGDLSIYAHRVYSLFLHFARQDERCWPGQEGLRGRAGCSERALRDAIRDLEKAKLIRTRRRGRGLTNVYVLLDPPRKLPAGAEAESRPAPDAGLVRREVPLSLNEQTVEEHVEQVLPPSPPPLAAICGAWSANAPPLIPHRPAYFTTGKVRQKVDAALKVYPVEAIVKAIENYATVLGPGYRWTHPWPLVDFLQRGLDRFVDEAKPLVVWRDFGAPAPGRFDDIDELG